MPFYQSILKHSNFFFCSVAETPQLERFAGSSFIISDTVSPYRPTPLPASLFPLDAAWQTAPPHPCLTSSDVINY